MLSNEFQSVFDADDVAGHFVLAMAMAHNDVSFAMVRADQANADNDPRFSYLVRLATAHLYEAMNDLPRWRARPEVRRLLGKLPTEGKAHLKAVGAARQRVGNRGLDRMRHSTFHYPCPDGEEGSVDLLASTLRANAERPVHLTTLRDGHVHYTFAADIALGMAFGKLSDDAKTLGAQLAVVRKSQISFVQFVHHLVDAYMADTGLDFGTPVIET